MTTVAPNETTADRTIARSPDAGGLDPLDPARLWFVTGIESNFRTFLPDAIEIGAAYGFDCRILDVSDLVAGWREKRNDWVSLNLARVVDRVQDFRALGESVSRGDTAVFLHLPQGDLRSVWRKLNRAGCRVGVATLGVVSALSGTERDGFAKVLRRALTRLVKPAPCFWIISGRKCVPTYRHFFRSIRHTKLIQAHSLDCERAIRSPAGGACAGAKRIVLLDQGWLSKLPPGAVPGVRYPPVTADAYGHSIRRLLGILQDTYGGEVVVAGHPKSDPDHTRALYSPYPVSYEHTGELVRQARLVVLNSTTAVHYAVLHRVPILFFTSHELSDSIMDPTFRALREEIGRPWVDIDDAEASLRRFLCECRSQILSTNERYEMYERDFIRAAPSDSSLWNVVFGALGQMAERYGDNARAA